MCCFWGFRRFGSFGEFCCQAIYYAPFGIGYGPQEQFSYEYTDEYNTRVVIAAIADTGWVDRSEILRNYNISGKMIDETVRLINATDEYRYEYAYELGNENLDRFPFYDKPLYEYIYPTLSRSLAKAQLLANENKTN